MGGALGRTGMVLPNLRWGRSMHPSPNISRSSVIGSVEKYELTKKRVKKEFFSEIEVFHQGKGHICYRLDFRQ